MAYIAVDFTWFGSFCQHCLATMGAGMSRDGVLTTLGKRSGPSLVLGYRENGDLIVEEEEFYRFVESLTDEEFDDINSQIDGPVIQP